MNVKVAVLVVPILVNQDVQQHVLIHAKEPAKKHATKLAKANVVTIVELHALLDAGKVAQVLQK